jgi:hypothetical protein
MLRSHQPLHLFDCHVYVTLPLQFCARVTCITPATHTRNKCCGCKIEEAIRNNKSPVTCAGQTTKAFRVPHGVLRSIRCVDGGTSS